MSYRDQINDEIAQKMRAQALVEAQRWGLPDAEAALALVADFAMVDPADGDAMAELLDRARRFYVENGGELAS